MSLNRLGDPGADARLITGGAFVACEVSENVGVAMDYSTYQRESHNVREIRAPVNVLIRRLQAQRSLQSMACLVALANSLAIPSVSRGHRVSYLELREEPMSASHWIMDELVTVDQASCNLTCGVVGFGGLMETFASDPRVGRVLVIDRHHRRRTAWVRRVLEALNNGSNGAKVELVEYDMLLNSPKLDILDVTGSALSNRSLSRLMRIRADRRVITGPTAGLEPSVLAESGFDMQIAECRPHTYMDMCLRDPHLTLFYDEYDYRYIHMLNP